MSTELQLGFDPYRVWLNVQEAQRPLNPYQLLGLKPLETDQARLRSAFTRQRSLMEARKVEAPPDAWEKINREVEEAIGKLQDPDQKMLVDAILKRQNSSRGPRPTPSGGGGGGSMMPTAAASAGHTEVICRDCETSNPSNRRFCSNCGAPLFDACPVCNTEVTASEKFCGACGTNLVETLRKQEAEYEEKIKFARQLQQEHQFEKAATMLRNIAVTEDARFDRFARKAVQLIERFGEERKQFDEKTTQRIAKAQRYMEKYAYEKALEVLTEVPEPLRTPELISLLAEARAKRNELLQLGGEIREAMANNRKHDLLPKIERMLGLKPDHAQARQLAEQLRDNICSSAKKKLVAHSYDEARLMLETIPTFVRNEEVEKLFDRATELDSLAVDIRLSPVIDDTLVALAERLAKLAPNDEGLAKQMAELKKRRTGKPADPLLAFPAWGTAPRRTLLGMPVDYLGFLQKVDYETPDIEETLKPYPGQFHVAFGLALQAVQQAVAPVDLMPAVKTTNLLNNMMGSMFKKEVLPGWGIDMSPTGIKAIRLAPDVKEGRIKILAAAYLPHSKPLSQAGDDVERTEIIQESLKQLKEKHNLPGEKDKVKEKVVIAMASRWTLGRFFDLPPIGTKKLHDAITFEAKHQIPIPLDELNWGYHVIKEGDGKDPKADASKPQHVVLVAAKDFHLKERLQHFKNADIAVSAVSAEPVALHNALMFQFLKDSAAENEYIGFMDVGAEGSSFLISSKNSIWFRMTGNAGNDLTANMVKRFQLTHAQAEDLKKNPQKSRRYHMYWDGLHPLFVQFSSEIERSVGSFVKQFPDRSIKRLYLLGGASLIHGLLRYLIHGR